MEEHIGIAQLLQGGLEGLHQVVGQLADKAHGVGEQDLPRLVQLQTAGGGVQGIKEPVVGGDIRTGEPVEQGALAGVGVAH